MQINEIKAKLNSNEYNFLKTDKCLGSNVILLTTGGSHAYGTDTENSDLDIRGCAVNSRMGILASGSFRQFTNMDELIGEDFEQFTDNATDTVIYSFNKLIFLLANCNPNTIDELQTTVKSYAKAGKRNEKAAAHKKIAKHSMHLLKLYMMCIDILEQQKIVTYREKEHDLLMDIRNGKYLGADDKPLPEFFELVNEYEKKLEYAKKNATLPDEPDYRRIMEFTAYVNERVVKGEM